MLRPQPRGNVQFFRDCSWRSTETVWSQTLSDQDPTVDDTNVLDVYDKAEVEAMSHFHAVWDDVASAVLNNYPLLSKVQAVPEWGSSAMRLRLRSRSS